MFRVSTYVPGRKSVSTKLVVHQHYERFGMNVLRRNGFDIRLHDFSPIVFN